MQALTSSETPDKVIDITARLARSATRRSEPPCLCATSLEHVQSAWRLVYDRYTEMGLIDPNPFRIHAVPTAVGEHACVIWGPEGLEVGYTMTLFRDNPMGLALDSVYASHLDKLRRNGRRLLEVGMLADVIVVDGDPLADIRILGDKSKLRHVIAGGVHVNLDRPWPVRSPLPGEKVFNWSAQLLEWDTVSA